MRGGVLWNIRENFPRKKGTSGKNYQKYYFTLVSSRCEFPYSSATFAYCKVAQKVKSKTDFYQEFL